jgi:hypothetical protein
LNRVETDSIYGFGPELGVAGCEEIDVGGDDVEDHCCEEEKQDVDAFKVSARLCYPPGDLHYYYFVLFCFA